MPAPRVNVRAGFTKNMGEFESLRLDFGLEVDSRPEESPKQAQERVYSLVADMLIEKVHELESQVNNVKSLYKK